MMKPEDEERVVIPSAPMANHIKGGGRTAARTESGLHLIHDANAPSMEDAERELDEDNGADIEDIIAEIKGEEQDSDKDDEDDEAK
jgi:hypothetical protein